MKTYEVIDIIVVGMKIMRIWINNKMGVRN